MKPKSARRKKYKFALHLAAPNDTNGNPRRLYAVLDSEGGIADVVDEGYQGSSAATELWGPQIRIGARIEITPGEYRAIKAL